MQYLTDMVDDGFEDEEDPFEDSATTTGSSAGYTQRRWDGDNKEDWRRRRAIRDTEISTVRADRILCLSGNSHAGMAFQCGALVALQELGQLQRVGVVSAVGTGCIPAAALASLWRHAQRPVPEAERTRHSHTTYSWSSVTSRDVSNSSKSAAQRAAAEIAAVDNRNDDEYEPVDTKMNDTLALRGSGLLRRNALLVENVCAPVRAFTREPHEWRMLRRRLCDPRHWFHAYNHEMVGVIYRQFRLDSIRSGLTLPELCRDKQYSNEPVTPIFNFALRSTHTDALVVVSNTGINKVHEPPDGRIANRNGIELGIPLAAHDQDMGRLLASIALPGPGTLLQSLDWHRADDLVQRMSRRLTLSNASHIDPLALQAGQMWFQQHALDDPECLFVVDAFTHSPLFEDQAETDRATRRATLLRVQELMTHADAPATRETPTARCVGLQPIQCFDQRLLARVVNARKPILEMEVFDPSLARDDDEANINRRTFHPHTTHLREWYECMKPYFCTRMASLPDGVFRAIANWGYLLTYMLHATDVQFARFQTRNAMLYECLPSDSTEVEQLMNGFGIHPANVIVTPVHNTPAPASNTINTYHDPDSSELDEEDQHLP